MTDADREALEFIQALNIGLIQIGTAVEVVTDLLIAAALGTPDDYRPEGALSATERELRGRLEGAVLQMVTRHWLNQDAVLADWRAALEGER